MGTCLVGRVAEVVALDELRAAAERGSGAVALLTGEAGIGKTAVVEEAVSRAAAAGVTVLTGRADPDEGAPAFWPWLRLLDSDVDGLSPSLLALTDEGEPAAAARFRAIRDVLAALTAAAARTPLVLVLEDLHWADPSSLALLAALAREVSASRILVLGTSRTELDLPEATVLPLGPWDVAAVAAYLGRLGAAHGTWAAVVHELGGGNPLYTRELGRLLVREGRLERPAGDIDLPDGLRRLVTRRTAQLTPACREALGVAAAFGAEVDTTVLDLAELTEAIEAGVLVDDPWAPARPRFAHELVRQACYADLSRDARIRAHARIADALAATGAGPIEIARHRVRAATDAASRRLAAEACLAAARQATAALDHGEAVRWLTRALENEPSSAIRLERAGAAYRDGQLDLAVSDCEAIVDQVGAPAALVVRGLGGLGGPLAPALLRLCERALAHDLGDADRAQVLAQYAFLIAEMHDGPRAEPISREAMALAERSGHPGALVAAIHARHEIVDPMLGVDEVLDMARRGAELAVPGGRPDAELWSRVWRLDAYLCLGDLAGFDAEQARLAELADRLGWPVARWHHLRARAVRHMLSGHLAEALATAVEARDLALRAQDTSARLLLPAFQDGLGLLTGDIPGWDNDLAEIAVAIPGVPIGVTMLARIAMRVGDRGVAVEQVAQLRGILPRLPVDGRRPFILISAGEVAAWVGDLEFAAECYRLALPYAGRYMNNMSSCNGAADRSLGVIAAALREPAAVRHLTDAIAMEERLGSPPFLALAQLTFARHAAGTDPKKARDMAGRALAIARRLGLPKIAEEAATLAGDDLLTAREREIAGLVATGLSNRDVADRLFLSERTVETHVRSILRKLGLSGRADLRGTSQYQH
ncbi:AAA family ATPase [Actinoplanes sp. KI2]|uniref:ATP-binding protein n=1 Tax=Actinoplanes sp. KI2 TaxID=2983315 RepID=UPI0021D5B07A|nr:LuxR family transcriptional regulator [Actinoplanes sp. KI2]MCU7725076.1 AAA family ATPase [Actinoplanes sp. KI2]